MGFSLIAATAIIGASMLVALTVLTGGILPTMTEFRDSYSNMKNRAINIVQTDIDITSASTSPNASNYNLNFTLNNIGSTTLKTSDFTVLINGTSQPFSCSVEYIYFENAAYFYVYNLNGTGSKKLKVVTDNGISEYYEYIA
jgi:archaellum component FlaF (FlaF/FlaG flagellin family)